MSLDAKHIKKTSIQNRNNVNSYKLPEFHFIVTHYKKCTFENYYSFIIKKAMYIITESFKCLLINFKTKEDKNFSFVLLIILYIFFFIIFVQCLSTLLYF